MGENPSAASRHHEPLDEIFGLREYSGFCNEIPYRVHSYRPGSEKNSEIGKPYCITCDGIWIPARCVRPTVTAPYRQNSATADYKLQSGFRTTARAWKKYTA
ncbi:hypothetical protein J6590_020721 [Homalodisca vitripennis]|nr:hypothetical protein J6590_020721 [Homalodisca vitripennis]